MRERISLPTLSPTSYRVIVSSALFFLLLTIGTTLTEAQGAITRWGAFVYTGNTPYGPPSNTLVNGYAINTTAGTLTKVAGSPFATGGQVLAIANRIVELTNVGACDCVASFGQICLRCERQRDGSGVHGG